MYIIAPIWVIIHLDHVSWNWGITLTVLWIGFTPADPDPDPGMKLL